MFVSKTLLPFNRRHTEVFWALLVFSLTAVARVNAGNIIVHENGELFVQESLSGPIADVNHPADGEPTVEVVAGGLGFALASTSDYLIVDGDKVSFNLTSFARAESSQNDLPLTPNPMAFGYVDRSLTINAKTAFDFVLDAFTDTYGSVIADNERNTAYMFMNYRLFSGSPETPQMIFAIANGSFNEFITFPIGTPEFCHLNIVLPPGFYEFHAFVGARTDDVSFAQDKGGSYQGQMFIQPVSVPEPAAGVFILSGVGALTRDRRCRTRRRA